MLVSLLLAASQGDVHGAIDYSTAGMPLLETFDSLPNSGLPSAPDNESLGNTPFGWADDTATPASGQTSIVGWYLRHPNGPLEEGGANGHQRLRVSSDAVTTATGAFYSFGNLVKVGTAEVPSPERALGAIASAFLAPNGGEMHYGMRLTNTTGVTLSEFTVNYTGEQWRVAANPTTPNQSVTLDYRLGGTDLDSGTFTEIPGGGFDSIVDSSPSPGAGLNGNLPANQLTGRGATVSDIRWAPGTDLWVRWSHTQYAGTDHGLAIDDVAFTAVPEPGALGTIGVVGTILALARRKRVVRQSRAASGSRGENPVKRSTHAIASFMTVALLASVASAVPSGVGPLTFEDQFEGDSLDTTTWFHRGAGTVREQSVVNPSAVQVQNGILKMKVFTDTVNGLQVHNSGVISTSKFATPGDLVINPDQFVGFEQTYGYWEARVRFHDTSGAWSAFWLQSDTIGSPKGNAEVAGVEMDIFEHRVFNPFDDQFGEPYDVASKIHMGLIWDGYPSPPGSNIATHNQSPAPYPSDIPGLVNNDPAGTWHTAGLLWTPEGYTFYFDDVPIWLPPEWVPVSQRSQYIILSTHVWAEFAGAIPPLGYGTLANTTTYTEYDYVRVYAIPEPAALGIVAIGALAGLLRRRQPA